MPSSWHATWTFYLFLFIYPSFLLPPPSMESKDRPDYDWKLEFSWTSSRSIPIKFIVNQGSQERLEKLLVVVVQFGLFPWILLLLLLNQGGSAE
ncbi:hypothetical protein F5051DRAFT_407991 [Lentinula edodes]|nr:hypothetical protein F5051DRAFT_407991 [Lentinula edodes]